MKEGEIETTVIDGYTVHCYPTGTLVVVQPERRLSVLKRGTHASLDVLGQGTKARVTEWWRSVR